MTTNNSQSALGEYDFQTLEKQQQALWDTDCRYHTTNEPSDKPTRYMLSMFPYPSGKLHMGHVRNYAITDALSRYYRLKGYEVMQPMGWDAFGLPAENAAIAHKVAPAQWTHQNIDHMRGQLKALGLSIDWGREFATCSPDYYKWEQWLFIQLYKKGLVYKKLATVNWDPVDQTVLANEQVIDGRGWRSGAIVEKRDIPMYYFKITEYADELLQDLELLEGHWPKQVLTMQKNWIGRSVGMTLSLPYMLDDKEHALDVFTTRPDTLMGVSFVCISAEHSLAASLALNDPSLQSFIDECKKGSVAEADLARTEKLGVATGFFVNHPLTDKPIPVWIGNYVLMSYGTGAVMGVPAHDERDFAFAKKYGLPILPVISTTTPYDLTKWRDDYAQKGTCINSGSLDGLDFEGAFDAILAQLAPKNLAQKTINYRLRDWGVSRQRYWGCPIPMVNCEFCGSVPVDESQLPVVLPTDVVPDGRGNPLKQLPEFLHTTCPKCGQPAERETDTFDTFMESSWYAQRFTSPHDSSQMIDPEAAKKWLPIDQYVGGIEHAILHLLYARFFHKVMRDEGLVSGDEPFLNLLAQGMVLAGTYYRENSDGSKTYYFADEVERTGDEAVLKADGQPVIIGKTEKMSKSKNNGVDPEQILKQYGADTARLYTLFTAPADQTLEWSDAALKGPHNFLKKVWRMADELLLHPDTPAVGNFDFSAIPNLSKKAKALRKKTHETIAKIDTSLGEQLALNTPVSALMELANELSAFDEQDEHAHAVRYECLIALLTLLSIFAPHIGEHLLHRFGMDTKELNYPSVDSTALVSDTLTIVVQVNGKVRGEIEIAKDTPQELIKEQALALPSVAKFIETAPKKVIIVPNKLVSVVV